MQKASDQVHLAGAADREKLCAGAKSNFSGDLCLEHHARALAEPCFAALNQARQAWVIPQ